MLAPMDSTDTPRLGIDIGRVIIDGSSHPDGGDTAFFAGGIDNALRTPPMAWLAHHRFHERSGLPAGNVRFCRHRPEKALLCAELGISHMIDDRLDVHRALAGVVAHRFAFGPQPGPLPAGVVHTPTWAAAGAAVAATLPGGLSPRP